MNLPDWATHVAVDARSGEVWAFSCEPVWSEANGTWNIDDMERHASAQMMEHLEEVPQEVARLLCVAIPRREEGDNSCIAVERERLRDA